METEKMSVNNIIEKYKMKAESLIAILQDIQDNFHYLSESSLKKVAKKLNISLNRVFSVATFYNAFSLKPKGKNLIQVCLGTACHIKGGNRLIDELSLHLGIKENETTKDALFSIEAVRCLGCCSLAPVMMINGRAYGNLSPEKIKNIIEKYKS